MAEANDVLRQYNVTVKGTEKKGKGLFAEGRIKEGDVILIEKPLVCSQFLWNKTYSYTACEYCLKSMETAQNMARRLSSKYDLELPYAEQCCDNLKQRIEVFQCPRCKEKYCSEICFQNAEQKYHRLLCLGDGRRNASHPINQLDEAWKKVHYPPETATVNLILKMVAMITQSSDPKETREDFLQFHAAIRDQSQKMVHKLLGEKFTEQLETMYNLLQEVSTTMDLNKEVGSLDDLRTLFGLIGMNGQGIGTSSLSKYVHNIDAMNLSEDEREKVDTFIDEIYDNISEVSGQFLNCEGSGLFKVQSRSNHSCEPNAEVTFPNNNSTLVLVALQNIQPGEEICICYLDDCQRARSRHSRRKILRENYLFECTCTRCELDMGEISQTSSSEEEESEDDCDEMDED
ncbi:histone-lysine N-trimethyltransferase SMYD5-like [Clytia hemisphaerica]|uniref:SET domain-containing protein n=1 Tax=Clytia hemisphaerica TaxID=252671 RepID=A0A7M5VE43_9CNID|eukprot:TCONS_00032929-protein